MFYSARSYLLGFGLLSIIPLHTILIPSLAFLLCIDIIYVPTYPRDYSRTHKTMLAYALHVRGPNAYPILRYMTLQS